MIENLKHDQLFRYALDEPKVAIDFLNANLSEEYKELVELDTVKVEKGSFVEKALRNSITDVLFSAKLKNKAGDGYIYLLFEHFSKHQHFTAFRLLRYMVNIWSFWLIKNKKSKVLPLIIPHVYYNNKAKYTAPKNLWGLFQNPNLAKKILISDYKLINITQVPDKEIKKRKYSGLFEYAMKYVNNKDIINKLQEAKNLLKNAKNVSLDYIEAVLYYILPHVSKNDIMILEDILHETLNKEGNKLMTSLAQHWKQEGIQQGIQQEKFIIAQNLLVKNLDTKLVAETTGLSLDEIKKLAESTKKVKAKKK